MTKFEAVSFINFVTLGIWWSIRTEPFIQELNFRLKIGSLSQFRILTGLLSSGVAPTLSWSTTGHLSSPGIDHSATLARFVLKNYVWADIWHTVLDFGQGIEMKPYFVAQQYIHFEIGTSDVMYLNANAERRQHVKCDKRETFLNTLVTKGCYMIRKRGSDQ